MKTKKEIEQLARNVHFDMHTEGLNADGCFNQLQGYIKGYTQCQEDMTDKKLHRQEHSKTWDESMRNLDVRGGNIVRAWDDFDEYYEKIIK